MKLSELTWAIYNYPRYSRVHGCRPVAAIVEVGGHEGFIACLMPALLSALIIELRD